MSDLLETDPTFLPEVWAFFGIGCCILFARFAVRIRTVGLRGFQGDDLLVSVVVLLYAFDAASVHIIYYWGTNVEAEARGPDRILSPSETALFEAGSKMELAAWYSYTALIWCLKGAMLFFFKRMTMGLWQHRLVNWLAGICIVTYLSVFFTITLGCRPFERNWQVIPDPGRTCAFKPQNIIVTTIMNVLTDSALLSIPLPLLWKLQIPIRKKVVLGLFLCSGLFVITAALVRAIVTLGSHPSAVTINRWGVIETIVGIITVNLPILRPVFSRSFWRQPVDNPQWMFRFKSNNASSFRPSVLNSHDLEMGMGGDPQEVAPSQNPLSANGNIVEAAPKSNAENNPGDPPKHATSANSGQVLVETIFQVRSEVTDEYSDEERKNVAQKKTTTAYTGDKLVDR